MLGLIKKDLLVMKNNLKYFLLMILVFAFFSRESNIIYFIPIFISIMIFITTFSYDDYNKWNTYAITLPLSREKIVLAKYMTSLLLMVGTVLITFLLSFVIGTVNHSFDFDEVFPMLFGGLFALVLLQSFMYPLIYQFGTEKGRIGLFVGVFAVSGLVGYLVNHVKIDTTAFTGFIQFFNQYGILLLSIVMVILFVGSYFVSKRIYLKKEF